MENKNLFGAFGNGLTGADIARIMNKEQEKQKELKKEYIAHDSIRFSAKKEKVTLPTYDPKSFEGFGMDVTTTPGKSFLIEDFKLNGVSNLTPFAATYFDRDISWLTNINEPTAPDVIAEFAARICYKSDNKMFSNDHFLRSRLNEGHNDVIEHSWLSVVFVTNNCDKLALDLFLKNKYANITPLRTFAQDTVLVSANLRVWEHLVYKTNFLEHFSMLTAGDFKRMLYYYSPKVFEDFKPKDVEDFNFRKLINTGANLRRSQILPVINKFGQKVALMSYMESLIDVSSLEDQSATFLIEHVSVPCATQITRHRLGSYSQESKRYVELEKGEWKLVKPESIKNNSETDEIFELAWNSAKAFYQDLREKGIRKEDARFIMPMATDTRIVHSMSLSGWKHYFELRAADKSAQWEIRALAQNQLSMLAEAFPNVFGDLWEEVKNNAKVLIV